MVLATVPSTSRPTTIEVDPADVDGWQLDDIERWFEAIGPGFKALRLHVGLVLWKTRTLTDEAGYRDTLLRISAKLGVPRGTLTDWRATAEKRYELPPAGARSAAAHRKAERPTPDGRSAVARAFEVAFPEPLTHGDTVTMRVDYAVDYPDGGRPTLLVLDAAVL